MNPSPRRRSLACAAGALAASRAKQLLSTASILLLAVFWMIAAPAEGQAPGTPPTPRRGIALVVGNEDYPRLPLENPVNDAQAVARSLRRLGFEVIEHSNASKRVLDAAVDDFISQIGKYDIALFFYSGHGIQLAGENYLIPIDSVPSGAITDPTPLYRVSQITRRMRGTEPGSTRTNIVILDACRQLGDTGRAANLPVGLARPSDAAGVLVAFSAGYGQVASDGTGGNSPYVSALLKHLATPGLALSDLFRRVRTDVEASTNGRQSPREDDGLVGYDSLVLNPSSAGVPPGGQPRARPAVAPPTARSSGTQAAAKSISLVQNIKENPDQGLNTLREEMARFPYELTGDQVAEILKTLPAPTHQAALPLLIPSLPDAVRQEQIESILDAIPDRQGRSEALMRLAQSGKLPNEILPKEAAALLKRIDANYSLAAAPLLALRIHAPFALEDLRGVMAAVGGSIYGGTALSTLLGSRKLAPSDAATLVADAGSGAAGGPAAGDATSVAQGVRQIALLKVLLKNVQTPFPAHDLAKMIAGTDRSSRLQLLQTVSQAALMPPQLSDSDRDELAAGLVPADRIRLFVQLEGSPNPAAATGPSVGFNNYKAAALAEPLWFRCQNAFCSFDRLGNFVRAVKRIEFGESASKLDRSIDVPHDDPGAGSTTPAGLNSHPLPMIPIRRGATSEFVRLEFTDGSKSEVRPATIDRETRRTIGIELMASDAAAAPHVFVGFTLGASGLEFTPDIFPGTEAVLFSFDDGGFFEAEKQASRYSTNTGFRFIRTPPANARLRLKWILKDGSERGPITYGLNGAETLEASLLKALFAETVRTSIQCVHITEFLSSSSRGATTGAPGAAPSRATLMSHGLGFVTSAPAVACLPSTAPDHREGVPANYLVDWAAVREVHLGTESGKLGETITVTLDPHARGMSGPRVAGQIWHALMPPDATSVYSQVTYADGTASAEFRIPVIEFSGASR